MQKIEWKLLVICFSFWKISPSDKFILLLLLWNIQCLWVDWTEICNVGTLKVPCKTVTDDILIWFKPVLFQHFHLYIQQITHFTGFERKQSACLVPLLILILFFRAYNAWHFTWIACLALTDDSDEMPTDFQRKEKVKKKKKKKKKIEMSSAVVAIGALRDNWEFGWLDWFKATIILLRYMLLPHPPTTHLPSRPHLHPVCFNYSFQSWKRSTNVDNTWKIWIE